MKLFREILSIILSVCLVLTLMGCSGTETAPAESEPEATAPVESYLALAQGFVDKEDYAAAMAVLEEAPEDPRVDALRQEIAGLLPVDLQVLYTLHCSGGVTADRMIIHSFTAQKLPTGAVRCDLEYTAPAGMELQLQGRLLSYRQENFTTSGGRGRFVFDLPEEDLREMGGVFQLMLAIPDQAAAVLEVQLLWPGEEAPASGADSGPLEYEVGYLLYDPRKRNAVQIHSFRVAEAEDSLTFTLDITAQPGLKLLCELSGGVPIQDPGFTRGGDETLTFTIPRSALTEYENVGVFFQEDDDDMRNATVPFPIPLRLTAGQPVGEPERPGYDSRRGWTEKYVFQTLTMQELDNGYVRFSLDLTLPAGMYITPHLERSAGTVALFTAMSVEGQQTFAFDVARSDLRDAGQVTVLISHPGYENAVTILLGAMNARTDGKPVTEPVALECFAEGKTEEAPSCTVQLLDNDHYRYTLTFTASAGQRCSLFDPPNGSEMMYRFYATGGQQTFVADVEKTVADGLLDLTLLAGPASVIIKNVAALAETIPERVEVTVISCT